MPRRKPKPVPPVYTGTFRDDDGEQVTVEGWEKYPDEGKPGAHRRKARARVLDEVFKRAVEDLYNSGSPLAEKPVRELMRGTRGAADKFITTVIKPISRKERAQLKRSTLHEVARDVKRLLTALDRALEAKAKAQSAKSP